MAKEAKFAMDHLKQVLDRLYGLLHLPMALVDENGKYLHACPASTTGAMDPVFAQQPLLDFRLQKRGPDAPMILYLEPGFFLGIVQLPGNVFCLIGLLSPFPCTRQDVLQTCVGMAPEQLSEVVAGVLQAPHLNLFQLRDFICLLVQLAGGPRIQAENILFCDNTAYRPYGEQPLRETLFARRESTEEVEESFHVPTNYEETVCRAVESGNWENLARAMSSPNRGRIGKMSANALRQAQYSMVIFTSLICRAAIRGGLPEEEAFSLSDVYCQRFDTLSDEKAMQQLAYNMAVDFTNRVGHSRHTKGASTVTQQCIDYIGIHLHEDIRLEDLSALCSLCTRSLSLRFRKDTGMGIPEYIQREKIKEAKYLLGKTEYTLTEIAGILNFASQSYFAQIFKKYEGQTPQQYRSHNRG